MDLELPSWKDVEDVSGDGGVIKKTLVSTKEWKVRFLFAFRSPRSSSANGLPGGSFVPFHRKFPPLPCPMSSLS